MKKSYSAVKISFSIFLSLVILLFSRQPVYADIIANSRSGVLPDKTWTITFSNKVNYDYVNSRYITVFDELGNTVDMNLRVNPLNEKQVIVKPKSGKYDLGEMYTLVVNKDFCDEKGNKIKQNYRMTFSIKKQLIDTADFKVQVNRDMGMAVISLNSISSPDIKKFKFESQDDPEAIEEIGDEAYILGKIQNVSVYFYDSDGKEVGSSLVNIEKAYDSQIVQITN